MLARRAISLLVLVVFVSVAGCKKKQPKAMVPPAPSMTTLAALAPLPPLVIMIMQPTVLPPSSATVNEVPLPPANNRKKPKRNARKPSNGNPVTASTQPPTQTAQNSGPPRITIDRPPAGEGGGVFVGLEHSEEAHHRQTTAQLLQSTEDNLRALKRALSSDEQSTVTQIRNFLTQSRTAIADNDLVRAHNLALKAHLLSDELLQR